MQVSGDEAKGFDAIRLDSFAVVNKGVLVLADDQTGQVNWTDIAGEIKRLNLGDHAIRIVSRRR